MAVRIAGSLLIAAIMYWAVVSLAFCVAAIAYTHGIVIDRPWLLSIQRELYLDSGWNIWQTRPDCVAFDEQLLYKPKIGSCQFDNVEYKTAIHFTSTGRRMSDIPSAGKAIAVIGDSFAMGWGVQDEETFSSELQRRTGRQVYNLGVSSYGTARETLRLKGFEHLDSVDTVIIQYCDNDLRENARFRIRPPAEARRKFEGLTEPRPHSRWVVVAYFWRCYRRMFWYPVSQLSRAIRGGPEAEDFRPHYAALMNVLRNAPELRDKRILLFYVSDYGAQFRNFPTGQDPEMANLTFVNVHVDEQDFYRLDPHLNALGHQAIARQLAEALAKHS